MAESGGPLQNGGPLDNESIPIVLQTVDQLSLYVTHFQKHVNLELLIPQLIQHKILTKEEMHQLMHKATPPETRICSLVTVVFPSKGKDILELFKTALEDTLERDGSHGHQTLLENFFGMPPEVHSKLDADESHQTTADAISDESEEFSLLLMNFRKFLESGNERAITQRLKDVANYLCRLRHKKHPKPHLLKENVREKLDSTDLNFSKLLSYLESSNPPVVSEGDVSILHKIVDRVLKQDEGSKKIINPLKQLLYEYEQSSGIAITKVGPQIPAGNTRINVKVVNAHRSGPKLKNGVKKSFLESLRFNFRGSGNGSVVFYWDVPEECTHQLIESFENVCRNKVELDQLRITKVEVQLNQKPYHINLEMEIIDPVLLEAAQKQNVIADDIAPEQEKFSLFLINIDRLVGAYAEQFLSTSRKEHSRPYAHFENSSFKEMIDVLISENKLHCYDISYIQQFLLSLLKWDSFQSSKHKELITDLLKETQDYEPVSTGSPMPSTFPHGRLNSVSILTNFVDFHCVSYEIMMTMKYILLQLLHLSPSALQYIRWREMDSGCQIMWNTSPENFRRIESRLLYYPSTAALRVNNDFDIKYPCITFTCNIKNMQIVFDGSPLLCPDLDDLSLKVNLDKLCRVGHVCAACYIEYNKVFRLLWLHCFKPNEHQFAGKVNAVYDLTKSALCRVRRPPGTTVEQCSIKNCINGRKCLKAHSSTEFNFWKLQQSGRNIPKNYSAAVGKKNTVKHLSILKKTYRSITTEPSLSAIIDELTPSNYRSKFHHLLYHEELQHIEELHKRCADPVDVVIHDDVTVAESLKMNNEYAMIGYVVMKDTDSAKYVMQASQTVRLVLTDKNLLEADIVPLSVINKIEFFSDLKMEHVPIALNDIYAASFKIYCMMHKVDSSKTVKIPKISAQFLIKHHYFQDLHQAVDNILPVMIQRLFPSTSYDNNNSQKHYTDYSSILQPPFIIDNLQSEAISSMLSVRGGTPFLLVGPFGTGKTHVLACAAAAIVNEDASAKVLIATHHNKSADTFVSKFFGTYESTKTLPLTVAPIRIAAKDLREDFEKQYFVRFNDCIITKDLLDERRIVVTTFRTALHFAATEKLPRGYFTHILIDEGAQTREPETIAPLVFADERTKVIIAGDHLQVGPQTLVLGQHAIEYGLAVSLVKRLYNHYYDINNKTCSLISNLLINYRSHEAIMRLPSNLFYNSSVVSKSDSKLHPHTYYPLHFVCTSLEDGEFQNVSDVNCDEADIILNEVKKYTESWPRQWEKREKGSVCIFASSRNQVILLQQKVDLQFGSHSYIEVLPSFDIQGREFRAIFVSTAEATDDNGFCKNSTKSMTNPFVFNTVITRAQSLVVCVGNPYFLYRLEDKMKTGKGCWSAYIKNCLDYETFVCPNLNFGQKEKEDLQSTFRSDEMHVKQMNPGDIIIKGYLNSLAKFDLHKRALRFSKQLGDLHWIDCDNVESEDEENEHLSESQLDPYFKCVIDFQSRYHALARPIENPNAFIHINGQRNLRGAFHESTVLVELVVSPKQHHVQKQGQEKMFGRVVKLLSTENSTFLCEVDNHNFCRFYPTNKKDPIFFNLPTLSRVENGVTVFDPQSLNDVPRVLQVFPPQIVKKKIFVVQFLCWDPVKYKFPVGAVIDSIPKGYTFSAGEKLLRTQYKFNFENNVNFKPIVAVKQSKSDEAFTIVQKSGEIVENAFSVRASNKDIYYIDFYVINVAGYIKDEKLHESLKKRGVSAFVKTDKLNNWKLYSMFPNFLLRDLNFVLNEPRSCFKVSCLAEMRDGNVIYKPLDNPIKEVVCISTETFTLHEVESQIDSKEEFRMLFNIAQCLQFKRLGYQEAAYNCVFDIFETPRVQLILKEFASWANNMVANELAMSSLALFPLYCKLPPNSEEKQLVCSDHGNALQTSIHNKYYLPNNGYKPLPEVMINNKALPIFLKALKDDDIMKYLAMISYDNFFPQLHVASHKFRSIKRMKEFKSYTDEDDVKINFKVSHDSESYTTMFTSPLTSYFDIVVQDMLSAALNHKPSKYDKNELDSICGKANKDFKRKVDFEENVFHLQLGVTLKAFNHRVIGYINNIDNKNHVVLSFPSHELKSLSEHQSSFNIAHLFAVKVSDHSKPASTVSTTMYKWKVKVASFEGPPSIFTSKKVFLSEKERLKDSDSLLDITVFTASGKDQTSDYYIELDKTQILGSVESSAVTVSQNEWQKLTNVISNPTKESCKNAIKVLSAHDTHYSLKENFKQLAEQIVCWTGTIQRKLQQKYDALFTWFGAAQDTAIVYPKIQQIEIAPFLKICIHHNSEPEKCFANVSLVNASRDTYSDIDEYIELWGQVVIAENAVSSVKTKDILLLENVYLQWPELEYCCDTYVGDHYRIPKNEHIIMKPPLDFNRSNIELFDLQRGDLLCVQYEIADTKLDINVGFVFHMIVDKVEKISSDDSAITEHASTDVNSDEDFDHAEEIDGYYRNPEVEKTTHYLLTFSQSIEKISEKFKSVLQNKPRCQIQILHISPPQRRIYRNLCNLKRSSNMAQNIACGDTKAIDDIQDSEFSVEDISRVLNDENVTHLWDKPSKRLSKNQMITLRQACSNRFVIIHGPPGTGKSTVGAHLAYAFAKLNQINKRIPSEKNRCVVYCGASNVSVDVVARMLCDFIENKNKQQKHQHDQIKVLRVYPSNIEHSVYPNPFELLRNGEAASVNENRNFEKLMQHSLHYKIRNECGQLGEKITKLESDFIKHTQKEKLASKADRKKYKDVITTAQNKILSDDIDILICTCNEMASARIFNNIEAVQIIIDEAAMVTEPESMIPIQRAEQIILIGDHQQLQPKVHSRHASRNGLTTSLFQRYVQYDPCILNEQFRMHKRICEFIAENFYVEMGLFTNKTTVKEMEKKAKRLERFWPNGDSSVPFVFCDVVGIEEVTDTEFIDEVRVGQESKYNQKEAKKIVEIVKVLVNIYKVKQCDILALSPYQAQCKYMHDKLKADNLSDVKCTTVKSSEGNECGIVLLSTVRSLPLEDIEDPEALIADRGWLSENLGFLTDEHIINVGITRCQYGLVIVGNKCLLDYDKTWSNLINYFSKHGNVVPGTQFPSRSDVEKIKRFL